MTVYCADRDVEKEVLSYTAGENAKCTRPEEGDLAILSKITPAFNLWPSHPTFKNLPKDNAGKSEKTCG